MTSKLVAACGAILIATPSAAADIQAERLKLISQLTVAGVFQKLEKPAQFCRIWTGPRFDALPFDNKDAFVNIVYAYCITADPGASIVVVKDGRSGREIGEYSSFTGGLRLK